MAGAASLQRDRQIVMERLDSEMGYKKNMVQDTLDWAQGRDLAGSNNDTYANRRPSNLE